METVLGCGMLSATFWICNLFNSVDFLGASWLVGLKTGGGCGFL